ncbi:hypothetical protein AYO21_11131 [Fonsecaea monophora]|uniref:Zn(2)-C6 fungal-type domain-containing protein n=1 Tax=Fonsecaea monophora TaxID=254056 RepID=A0A177ESS8_9EURO|nr:hypothetical protein AYO21_11131 [Fonsecaea monophora]KAH0844780.1 C6 zinc finger domain-containing protein [Fonsecaea pedrosoi]OAG34696.1 hypothetical protein AYO21_11131 [Fonsecaea monophora]
MASHQESLNLTIVPYGVNVRQAHKKSRAGCYTCKTRHVKCGEEKPRCGNCVSKGKDCQYPASIKRRIKKQDKARGIERVSLEPTTEISMVSASFTLHDLRLFHHFLCFAYPPLPLTKKSVWTQDIPQLSLHSEHLMNALLALAASHMETLTGVHHDKYTALLHKGRAISGLKDEFAKSHHSATEHDVMLATCYALAFQSALLPGSAVDFTTFVRGCALITRRIQTEGQQSVFGFSRNLNRAPIRRTVLLRIGSASRISGSHFRLLIKKGMASLLAAHESVEDAGTGHNLFQALSSTFAGFQVSFAKGYNRFLSYYAVWFKLAEAKDIFAPDAVREAAFLLWAFFIGIQLLIAMLVVDMTSGEVNRDRAAGSDRLLGVSKMIRMTEWLCAIETTTPTHMREHLIWPRLVSSQVLLGLQITTMSKASVDLKVNALRDLESRSHIALGELLELSASLANWIEDLLASQSGDEGSSGEMQGWRRAQTQMTFGILDQGGQDTPIDRRGHGMVTTPSSTPSPRQYPGRR